MIDDLVNNIKPRKYPGSTVRQGLLYHGLPFKGLDHLKSHRGRMRERLDFLFNDCADVRGLNILDLGCSAGGISLGVIEKGATSSTGIDYDEDTINVAKEAAKMLGYDKRTNFRCREITIDLIRRLPKYHVVFWLSQWMWIVKRHGMEYGKEMLYEVSKKADKMVFESAANDGMARILGASQDDIEKWLKESTVYERFSRLPSTGGWMNRDIFVCEAPRQIIDRTRSAATSVVERIAYNKVKKTFRPEYNWMLEHEVKAMKLLEHSSFFPDVLDYDDDSITMNFVGRSIPKQDLHKYKSQALEALEVMQKANIEHRDLLRKNFLQLNGRLYIIDFGWSLINGQSPREIAAGVVAVNPKTDRESINRLFDMRV